MTSALNQPLFTENSPRISAAMTLKGVDSIFGVLTAASRKPSIASSRIRNCQIRGTLISSFTTIKSNAGGIQSGFCISSRNVGVIKYVNIKIKKRESLR